MSREAAWRIRDRWAVEEEDMTDHECVQGATCVEAIIPILNVRNLAASIGYYVDTLGFKLDWQGHPAKVRRS